MSQHEVYKILEELGGIATTNQIKKKAREKYPQYTLYQYVTNRLNKLEGKGIIRKYIIDNEYTWEIIEKWPY